MSKVEDIIIGEGQCCQRIFLSIQQPFYIEYCDEYYPDEEYSDRGTGAAHDLSVWRPKLKSGQLCLGYVAVSGYGNPSGKMGV